jgi:hypothetical protein
MAKLSTVATGQKCNVALGERAIEWSQTESYGSGSEGQAAGLPPWCAPACWSEAPSDVPAPKVLTSSCTFGGRQFRGERSTVNW